MILIVEDDAKLGDLLREYLEGQHYQVRVCGDGFQAIDLIRELAPELVILDLMLPGLDGLSVCRQVRSFYAGKILFLTASDDDMDHVAGLELGADDFVRKPIQPRVLLARIRVLTRRAGAAGQPLPELLEVGPLTLDKSRRQALWHSVELNLTQGEFDLLWELALQAGQVVSRERLFQALRGIPYDGLDRSIDTRIVALRKKLGDDPNRPQTVITVRGQGYLLAVDH